MVRSISRSGYENAKDDTGTQGAALLADFQREVAGGECVFVEEPDGSKSQLCFDEHGEPFLRPVAPL